MGCGLCGAWLTDEEREHNVSSISFMLTCREWEGLLQLKCLACRLATIIKGRVCCQAYDPAFDGPIPLTCWHCGRESP